MIRILITFIFISITSINSATASAQGGFGGSGIESKPEPKLMGKKIVNKITLYNANKYDNKKSGQLITHEKLKREIIEALRMDILSSYSKECPVQSPVVSQDYAILVSAILKDEEGSSDWDDGVLEYQLTVGISTSDFVKILCVISHDSNLLTVIKKNQKRADDALATIGQLQYGSYDENKQGVYDRAVNIIRAANYFKEGVLSGVSKNTESALEAYENALEFCPDYPEVYYQRAELYRSMSRNKEAITEYSQAIKYDNNEAHYYIARGICYFDMEQQGSAMKDFSHVIDLKPSDPVLFTAYAARGNIYERSKEDRKALQDYTKAIELNPKATDIYFRKGLLNRGLKNYEDSIKDFDRVIELEKDSSDAYFERGTTYAYLGDKKKVLSDFKEAARLGSKNARNFLKSKNISWD
ncbi:MAG: tetratricopeptide repeat protein [Desulfobacteraceae bacterium]